MMVLGQNAPVGEQQQMVQSRVPAKAFQPHGRARRRYAAACGMGFSHFRALHVVH